MNKGNTLFLLAGIFLALGALSWYLMMKKDPAMEQLKTEREFAVKSKDQIESIILNNRIGDSIYLSKNEAYWTLNGRHKVFPNAIANLLQTLVSVKMQSIPPKTYYQSIMDGIRGSGIKVEVYGKNQKLMKSYWVGGATLREDGNFFLMEGSNQPYIVSIPSFVGNVRERYDLSYNDWRDRSLIDIDPANISSVTLEYPFQSHNSFKVEKRENKFLLLDIMQANKQLMIQNPKALQNYFQSFAGIGVEGIQNKHPEKEAIAALTPFCKMTILANGLDSAMTYKFYPIMEDTSGQTKINTDPRFTASGEFFRLHVVRSDGDFLLVQFPVIQPILRTKYDFLGQ
ncbi:MAG: DUF4340 domain-containing protein [Saprospiraceae bacterium]|nr:DUF4340 domain-containing protein [Saprospiraceae bacterium]